MPRPARIDFPDAVYHVTSRGNGPADNFHSDDDRRRFLEGMSVTSLGRGDTTEPLQVVETLGR